MQNSNNKVRFYFFNHSDGLFFDERKKRFVDFNEMDKRSYMDYQNTDFRQWRPDLFGNRKRAFEKYKFTMAQQFLHMMYSQRISEMARCFLIFNHCSYLTYIYPLWEHHLKLGDLDRNNPHRFYYWDDASRVVGYFDYVVKRIEKYGLSYGPLQIFKHPNYKQKIKDAEDNLVEYFLYEMRKAPAEQAELPLMPLK